MASHDRGEHRGAGTRTDAERHGLSAWRARDELRRSSASQPHRNKKHYTRKHKHRTWLDCRAVQTE